MLNYLSLSPALQERIIADRRQGVQGAGRCPDGAALRRDSGRDRPNLWRPAFVRDIEKILHLPAYNRYADKTQVFSFTHNDDITRRALHVQIVSRIARNIGTVLGLNLDLIEAIALGHDLGHTPFGHAGERFLNELAQEKAGRLFRHNIQSARVLDALYARNVSLPVLDGILCHNGELEARHYAPQPLSGFADYDAKYQNCLRDPAAADALVPATLEGCLVRVCDIVAYLGKDRQDAEKAHVLDDFSIFDGGDMGRQNAEIINNLTVSIIEHSYGRGCIEMDGEIFAALQRAKAQNYRYIYKADVVERLYSETIRPMMCQLYDELLRQARAGSRSSVLWRHHVDHINSQRAHYTQDDYALEDPHQMVIDYIASMTDDYFIDLHHYLFPKSPLKIQYRSYFDDIS